VVLLLHDAVRMHAFARQEPHLAVLSDVAWLAAMAVGFLLVSTAPAAASVWAASAAFGLLVVRPSWFRWRWRRRLATDSAVSASLEFFTLSGLAYCTLLLAGPIVAVSGVGALQGANVLRGPIILLAQALVIHRMSGPPIGPHTCVREAARLSATTSAATFLCVPGLILFRDIYGPAILGSTWPAVDPLVIPVAFVLVLGSLAFGPSTVVRKMGRFKFSFVVQGALAPMFVAFPLAGAAISGPEGFLLGMAVAYAGAAGVWWIALRRIARHPQQREEQLA
jgi:hypothetical protein